MADPFKDVPNLFELIAQDAQLREAAQAAKDFGTGAVLGNTIDLLGFPVQAVGDALNALGIPVGDKPVGGTNWLRDQFGQVQPADESLAQTLGSLVGLPDPQSAASLMGLAGAIRKGGNPELFAWHNTRAPNQAYGPASNEENLAHLLNEVQNRGSLTAPSIGISKVDPFAFTQTPSYVFAPGVLEQFPHQLFNRDAYTARRDKLEDPDLALAYAQKLLDARFTEGTTPTHVDHMLSVAASPNFKSFEDFETSEAGAKALLSLRKDPEIDAKRIALEEALYRSKLIDHESLLSATTLDERAQWAMRQIEELKQSPEAEAKFLLDQLQTNPSNYAEYKAFDKIPLNAQTLAGILVPGSYRQAANFAEVQDALGAQGLKMGTAADFAGMDPKELQDLAFQLAGHTGLSQRGTLQLSPAGRKLLGQAEEMSPDFVFQWAFRNALEKALKDDPASDAMTKAYLNILQDSSMVQTQAARKLTE